MRLIVVLLAAVGAVIIVAMTVAPNQPTIRDWYIEQACPALDLVSRDICGPVRRAAGEKAV